VPNVIAGKKGVVHHSCCLASSFLWDNGCKSFDSRQNGNYYQLLLKQPHDIEQGKSAKHYKIALENSGSTLVVKFPQPRAAKKVDKDIDGDDGTTLVLAAPDPLLALADASGSDASSGSGSSSSNSSSSSSSSKSKSGSGSSSSNADSNSIEGDGVVMPSTIDGNRLVRESHGADTGFRVVCPTHGHLCRKFRSLKKQVELYGPLAPAYFLGTWARRGADMELKRHREYSPTRHEIARFIERVEVEQ
jgi:hypothetical protein